jgi:hypothetical protein
MTFRRSLLARVIFVCALVLVGSACGQSCTCESCMSEGAYADSIRQRMDSFEYEVPPADAWREMRGVLSENGFTLAETTPKENATLSTSETNRVHYDVRLSRRSPARYAIALTRVTEEADDDGGLRFRHDRDSTLEWEVVQRVEPARAGPIRQEAEAKRQRSAAIGRGCDRGCACVCSYLDLPH